MAPLQICVVESNSLSDAQQKQIIALCNRAYEEELEPLFETFSEPMHVLGYYDGALVSHAMWVTRWLQAGDGTPMRTAYVEMVATEPERLRRGYASALMRRLAGEIAEFELGGLCTGSPDFYAKLGWETWRGPLFIRAPGGPLLIPEEIVMILRTPRTPPLNLEAPLSAEWREGELW
jgi:aminoglycoside 2'-N-acetyltransferase I